MERVNHFCESGLTSNSSSVVAVCCEEDCDDACAPSFCVDVLCVAFCCEEDCDDASALSFSFSV